MTDKPIGVMHLTDTLDPGGAERVAVNLVNVMPRERYCPYLCTTRRDGLLEKEVANDVGRLRLCRRNTLDVRGLWRLMKSVKKHRIRILHAHGTSVFVAAAASLFPPRPAVIWHIHAGEHAMADRSRLSIGVMAKHVRGVIAVNEPLARWCMRRLGTPAKRLWYIPNFVCTPSSQETLSDLPGKDGGRIVCVANIRPQKDHISLVRAMAIVKRQVPTAHLLLVGARSDTSQVDAVRQEISMHGLNENISLLGQRSDVHAILRSCDIGVLSSASEGLPLALIEYGMAGLPTVATRVGQCPEVLDEGRVGTLVEPGNPEELARGLLTLLRSPDERCVFGEQFLRHVKSSYSTEAVLPQVWQVYDEILDVEKGESRLATAEASVVSRSMRL